MALGTHRRPVPPAETRRTGAAADETRSQHRALHAGADARRQGFGRRAEVRPREILASPLRPSLAHRPEASARAFGRESRERARPAVAHRQTTPARLARGLRAADA